MLPLFTWQFSNTGMLPTVFKNDVFFCHNSIYSMKKSRKNQRFLFKALQLNTLSTCQLPGRLNAGFDQKNGIQMFITTRARLLWFLLSPGTIPLAFY